MQSAMAAIRRRPGERAMLLRSPSQPDRGHAQPGTGLLRSLLSARADKGLRAQHDGFANLAGLVHDLRSPLHGLLDSSERLALEETDPRRQQWLDEMRRSALHALQLTSDSLELARLERQLPALSPRPFRLETVLADVLAAVRPLRAEAVELCVDLTALSRWEFEGDPDRLRQILGNLVSNSLTRTRSGHVQLSAGMEGNQLRIEVQDTGPGMAQHDQLRMRTPFIQGAGKGSGQGAGKGAGNPGRAGLGLAMAERLAAQLGGQLHCHSQGGEGCCFRLSVPLQPLRTPAPRPRERRPLRIGFGDADSLEGRNLLHHLRSWNASIEEFERPVDLASWLGQPTSLDALIVSQRWLEATNTEQDLRRHCQTAAISLIVLTSWDAGGAGRRNHLPAASWPRPILPGELVTALDLRPKPPSASPDHRRTVLVVDDHPLVRQQLAAAVEALGAMPLLAQSGVAAVRAAAIGKPIDVVLLDRHMPGLDGLHAARILRRQTATRGARLILLVNDGSDAAATDEAALDHVLVRPIGRQAWLQSLQPLLQPLSSTETRTCAAAPPKRLLEDSLLEDLESLKAGIEARDRPAVLAQIHRLRGALRVFPAPEHERWLEGLRRAARQWEDDAPPLTLKAAVDRAERALQP